MRCPHCNGTGKRFVPTNKNAITGNGYTADCLFCNGTGEVEQTNDEWRRTCSTEEFATWLSKISKLFHECGKRDVYPKTMYEEDWEWWLKEKHGEAS